jgi:peptidoglycan/LPS O-acetylase OafA/YrhL
LLPRRPLVVVCCVIIFVALVTRLIMQHFDASSDAIFNVTFCRMDGLATGALIACLDTDRVGHLIVRFRWLALAMIASVMTILCYFNGSTDGHGHVIEGVGFTIVALCSAVILLLAIQSAKDSWFGRFFRAGILRFFGRYSYGIYAIHPFVLYICWLMLGPEKIKSHISSHFLQENTFRFVAFPIFVGLAVLSFELYEKQFLKLKKFFQ